MKVAGLYYMTWSLSPDWDADPRFGHNVIPIDHQWFSVSYRSCL